MAGVTVLTGALAGAWWWTATGAQPAEALPASTLAYVGVDLDPSGSQKVDALRTLQQFPILERELGLDGDPGDIDVTRALVDVLRQESDCEALDHEEHVAPWFGDRAAAALVDLEDDQAMVLVFRVTDTDAAEDGLDALADCVGGAGHAVDGDWAVFAETDAIARDVVAATRSDALGDDQTFQRWTDEAGDPGVVTLYVAPGAPAVLDDMLGFSSPMEARPGSVGSDLDPPAQPAFPTDAESALDDFEGMAATLRFDDGGLELEVAGSPGAAGLEALANDGLAGAAVADLPSDTAVALGLGFEEGWFGTLVDMAASSTGGYLTAEEMLQQMEDASGLDLPGDAETLAGESVVLALDGDLDPGEFFRSQDGSDVPVGLRVRGDGDAISAVLERLRAELGDEVLLEHDAQDDGVAVGPDADYREKLLEDGDLGDDDVFRDVVREADESAAVLFVDVDAVTELLVEVADGDAKVGQNLDPLAALGLSVWVDDGVAHSVLRVTTD